MTNYSKLMMLAVVVVAFIAGYSVVSFAVRKFREGAERPRPDDHDDKRTGPTSEDRWR